MNGSQEVDRMGIELVEVETPIDADSSRLPRHKCMITRQPIRLQIGRFIDFPDQGPFAIKTTTETLTEDTDI
jgi:hypothetical protein